MHTQLARPSTVDQVCSGGAQEETTDTGGDKVTQRHSFKCVYLRQDKSLIPISSQSQTADQMRTRRGGNSQV